MARLAIVLVAVCLAATGWVAEAHGRSPKQPSATATAAACWDWVRKPATPAQIKEIAGLFDRWNAALLTGNASKVADMYAPGAVLVPTVSNKVRDTRELIIDYFTTHFLPLKPNGTIVEKHPMLLSPHVAVNSGLYDFQVVDPVTKATIVKKARFSYVYKKASASAPWLIVSHHSSGLPEAVSQAEPTRGRRLMTYLDLHD